MPQSRTRLVWSLALSALIGSSACGGSSKPGEGGGAAPASSKPRYQIAVIPKGTTHSFWSTIHAGAVKAERELQGQGIDAHVELLPSLDAVHALRDGSVDFVAGGAHTTLRPPNICVGSIRRVRLISS